jgi:hypothetical protein
MARISTKTLVVILAVIVGINFLMEFAPVRRKAFLKKESDAYHAKVKGGLEKQDVEKLRKILTPHAKRAGQLKKQYDRGDKTPQLER